VRVDDESPEILRAVRGAGDYDERVRDIVAAVLRRHDLNHRDQHDTNGSLYACIEHDIHEDVARALHALAPDTDAHP
jgi:hypothetical protein